MCIVTSLLIALLIWIVFVYFAAWCTTPIRENSAAGKLLQKLKWMLDRDTEAHDDYELVDAWRLWITRTACFLKAESFLLKASLSCA